MDEELFEEIIDKYADKVDTELSKSMEEFSRFFGFSAKDTTLTSGKHLRGVLTHIVAHAIAEDPGEITDRMAVLVEMLHQFSLIHDDIMDDDDLRRGMPSLWKMIGIGKSILVGDAGFAQVISFAASESGLKAVQAMGDTLVAVARGVVYEFSDLISPNMNEKAIENKMIEIMELKTSALFALAGQYGALSVNAGPFFEKLSYMYGKKLGTLLQFLDDYVDVLKSVDSEEAGDIKFNRITLPMYLIARESGEEGMKAAVQFAMKQIKYDEVVRHMDFEKGNDAVLKKIDEMMEGIKNEAMSFPPSLYRDVLIKLPEHVHEVMLDEL